MSLLPAVTAYLKDGHAIDADFPQSIFDGIEPRGLNDRFQFRHKTSF
jgi:hypothetical protein